MKTYESVVAWLDRRHDKRVRPDKIEKAIADLEAAQRERDERQERKMDEIMHRLDSIEATQTDLGEQIATVQNEKLMWAYLYYGVEKHPIPLSAKSSILRMYNQYKGKHNHVPDDFEMLLESAPVEGTKPYERTEK